MLGIFKTYTWGAMRGHSPVVRLFVCSKTFETHPARRSPFYSAAPRTYHSPSSCKLCAANCVLSAIHCVHTYTYINRIYKSTPLAMCARLSSSRTHFHLLSEHHDDDNDADDDKTRSYVHLLCGAIVCRCPTRACSRVCVCLAEMLPSACATYCLCVHHAMCAPSLNIRTLTLFDADNITGRTLPEYIVGNEKRPQRGTQYIICVLFFLVSTTIKLIHQVVE